MLDLPQARRVILAERVERSVSWGGVRKFSLSSVLPHQTRLGVVYVLVRVCEAEDLGFRRHSDMEYRSLPRSDRCHKDRCIHRRYGTHPSLRRILLRRIRRLRLSLFLCRWWYTH